MSSVPFIYQNDKFITTTELATIWGCHPHTVRKLVRDGVLKPAYKGSTVFVFCKEDVFQKMESLGFTKSENGV